MANFVVNIPLETERFQEDVLDKRFEIARRMYNSLTHVAEKRYKEMIKTKVYRSCVEQLNALVTKEKSNNKGKSKNKKKNKLKIEKQRKLIYKQLAELREKYKLSKEWLEKDIKPMQHHFKCHIGSADAQKIAARLWESYEKLFFGNGNNVHYCKYENFRSVEGKSNNACLTFGGSSVRWNGFEIPVHIDKEDAYLTDALTHKICFCRLVQTRGTSKNFYSLQLVLEGVPPIKVNKKTGEPLRVPGKGRVGIDIGTRTIAVVGEKDALLTEIADKVAKVNRERRLLQRKMDRSRRIMNKDNYDSDGTVKKGATNWENSNNYMKLAARVRKMYRKEANLRKQQHEELASKIISFGNEFYIEEMNFAALQKRAKKDNPTEVGELNEAKPNKRKKRFGKSLGNKAPAMLISIIDRKLGYHGLSIVEINTKKAKASQYNHATDTYKKKTLRQRWNVIYGKRVQRDLYSAFLIKNINPDLETFNKELCNATYDSFKKNHDIEIKRLKTLKNPSSIGV